MDFGEIKPIRGHGQGMANALTTLMQYCIYFIVKDRVELECGAFESDALFLNDDGVVYMNDHVDEFQNADFDVCLELGLLPKPSKSFISTGGSVFCENYYFTNKLSEKKSYYGREFNLALNAVNIVHAKQIFNSA
jgi:hypothetical protein